MEIIDKAIFYVSSKDRVSGDSSAFLYSFNLPQNNDYDKVAILAASIPKSYYLITTDNDEFTLTESAQSVNMQIPSGNYSITAWITILTEILNNNSPNGWNYIVEYPLPSEPNTGKLKFSVTGNNSQPSLTFSEYLYIQMGFNPGTFTFNNDVLYSVNVISLQLENALFINSDVCNNKNNSILQEIYSNNDDFSNITYKAVCPTVYGKDIAMKNNYVYSFYLTNVYGKKIDLNGLNWDMTIMFYKHNNIFELIRSFMKYSLLQ